MASLALIPITLGYLGTETYGLWMTVAALTSMVLWADLGLGNGLLTKLGACHAKGDWLAARAYVSGTYAVLTGVSVMLLTALWLSGDWVPWGSILNARGTTEGTARDVALVCLSAMLVNVPLSLVQRVQYGYQQVSQSNLWQTTGGLLSVAMAFGAVHVRASVVAVVTAAVAGPVVANVLNSVWLYRGQGRRLAPRPSAVEGAVVRSMLMLGGQFFVLSLVTSAALNSDNLIIAHTLGLEAVTTYSVPAKLFMALGLIVTLVNLPLWPANGEALARGDRDWVRITTRRMTMISAAAVAVPAMVLIFLGHEVLSRWLGGQVQASVWLLVALAVWWTLLAAASPWFMVQNSVGLIKPQLVGWTLFLLLSLPAKWLAANSFGVAGVAMIGAGLYLVTVLPSAVVGYRRALSRATSNARSSRSG